MGPPCTTVSCSRTRGAEAGSSVEAPTAFAHQHGLGSLQGWHLRSQLGHRKHSRAGCTQPHGNTRASCQGFSHVVGLGWAAVLSLMRACRLVTGSSPSAFMSAWSMCAPPAAERSSLSARSPTMSTSSRPRLQEVGQGLAVPGTAVTRTVSAKGLEAVLCHEEHQMLKNATGCRAVAAAQYTIAFPSSLPSGMQPVPA